MVGFGSRTGIFQEVVFGPVADDEILCDLTCTEVIAPFSIGYSEGHFTALEHTNGTPTTGVTAHDPTPFIGTDIRVNQLSIAFPGGAPTVIGAGPDQLWREVNNNWGSAMDLAGNRYSLASLNRVLPTVHLLGLFTNGSLDTGWANQTAYGRQPSIWFHPDTGDMWIFNGTSPVTSVGPADATAFNLTQGTAHVWAGTGERFSGHHHATAHPGGGFWTTSVGAFPTIYYHGPLGTHWNEHPNKPIEIAHIYANGNVLVKELRGVGEYTVTAGGITRVGVFSCDIGNSFGPAQVSPNGGSHVRYGADPATGLYSACRTPIGPHP